MKLVVFTLFILPALAQAGFFGEDEKRDNCYDWYGGRESCVNPSLKRESLIAGQFNSYYGERTGSMVGSYGQGLMLTTVKSHSSVRFLFGGQFIYSSANSFIDHGSAIPTKMFGADLIFGISIKPYRDTYLKPVFEISVIGGAKSIEFTRPPTGVETKNLGISYGGKLSVGIDIPLTRFTSLRPAIDYQITRVPKVLPDGNFVLDALGVSLGLSFR